MKTKISILLLVIALSCSAQTFNYVSNKANDMRTIADSIVSNAKRTYMFSNENQMKGSYITKIKYINPSDTTDILTMFYSKKMKGANAALELSGTPEYSFHSVYGKFKDLFPFWKKFIDTSSDPETASKELNEATVNDKRFYFRESNGQWEISMQ